MPKSHHTSKRGTHNNTSSRSQSREVLISKALSRLLRHAAVEDRIPIDSHGYVRVDHALAWRRLRSMQPPVSMDDIISVVKSNEKSRFGLLYRPTSQESGSKVQQHHPQQQHQQSLTEQPGDAPTTQIEPTTIEEPTETATSLALATFSTGQDTEVAHYFIRANQGHSFLNNLIDAENLLSPITLSESTSIPDTVVHGTFYGAWEAILREGAVKRMGRNHVHFSTGPDCHTVLEALRAQDGEGVGEQEEGEKGQGKGRGLERGRLARLMEEGKVVSGMRRDAEVLIYVDLKRVLREGEQGMKWWRSENGVVLTEGAGEEGRVESKWWEKVVEVKEGLGVLWEEGKVVKELPEHLKGRAVPKNKMGFRVSGRGGRGGGKSAGKQKSNVERDGLNGS